MKQDLEDCPAYSVYVISFGMQGLEKTTFVAHVGGLGRLHLGGFGFSGRKETSNPIVPLKYGVYGGLIICPKPYSIYLRGTLNPN